MMTQTATAASALVVTLLITLITQTPALAAGAPYCLARGGGNGSAPYVGNCVYNDYQQCLQAAAERGNCVQNIDYRAPGNAGSYVAAPAAARRHVHRAR